MNLEQIVTSKEISQQLAEVGVEHDSFFCWRGLVKNKEVIYSIVRNKERGYKIQYPAYTATELMELLPDEANFGGEYDLGLTIEKDDDYYVASYDLYDETEGYQYDKKFTDALGRMALYLSKEGLLK